MTTLCEFVKNKHHTTRATQTGTNIHERLRKVTIDDNTTCGDPELVRHISANPSISEYFVPNAKTEIPIAGTINGKFISRRIDRMIIDRTTKHIRIMDYKTDTNPDIYRTLYKHKLKEYCDLIRKTHPDFTVTAVILWTHNWTLENI